MAEQAFSIEGLHCRGCVDTVRHALTTLDEIESVTVDLMSTVTVATCAELTVA